MAAEQQAPTPGSPGLLARYERSVIDRITDFNDPRQEWRRLFSELLGTFFLVLAAAGGGMMGHAWVYIAGPIAGAALAVVIAFVLRGRGGDKPALGAAQGGLFTEGYEPGKS